MLPTHPPAHCFVKQKTLSEIACDIIQGPVPCSSDTEEQLREALAHTTDLDADERLLVHCHAGKSRSPAMAIGILVQTGLSPAAALEHVREVRPELIPNRLMIQQLDRLLGQGGELVHVVDAHYQSLGPEALLPNRGGLNL